MLVSDPRYAKIVRADKIKRAIEFAKLNNIDCILLDTAGRTNIDDALMNELSELEKEISPIETVLVLDSLTGQESVNVVKDFSNKIKLSGSIIISTPQDVALADARKGINMFKRVNVPILGLVENMSYFICDKCNEKHFIFSNDGAKKEAEKFQIPFLGSLPISKGLRIQSDEGRPACIDDPEGEISKKYIEIAKNI